MTPAALRAEFCPTIPWETCLASNASSNPRPRMWECAPERLPKRQHQGQVACKMMFPLCFYVPQNQLGYENGWSFFSFVAAHLPTKPITICQESYQA